MKRKKRQTVRFGLVVVSAAVLLMLVLLAMPNLISQMASPGFMIVTVFMVAISFLLALGIRKLADTVLPDPATPWYVRDGSGPYLVATVIVAGILTFGMGVSALVASGVRAAPLPLALESLAFVVVWILRLDWPRHPRRARRLVEDEEVDESTDNEPEWYNVPRQSSRPQSWRNIFKGKQY